MLLHMSQIYFFLKKIITHLGHPSWIGLWPDLVGFCDCPNPTKSIGTWPNLDAKPHLAGGRIRLSAAVLTHSSASGRIWPNPTINVVGGEKGKKFFFIDLIWVIYTNAKITPKYNEISQYIQEMGTLCVYIQMK